MKITINMVIVNDSLQCYKHRAKELIGIEYFIK